MRLVKRQWGRRWTTSLTICGCVICLARQLRTAVNILIISTCSAPSLACKPPLSAHNNVAKHGRGTGLECGNDEARHGYLRMTCVWRFLWPFFSLASLFISLFRRKTNTNHVDHCNQIAEGQPPVFRPPPHASQEEIRHLRREHLQMVRSLTPEEKRQRQLMRNRRTARISKQRRQDHLKTLKLENSKLRQALQTLYS